MSTKSDKIRGSDNFQSRTCKFKPIPRTREKKHGIFQLGHSKTDHHFELTRGLPRRKFKAFANGQVCRICRRSDLSDLSESPTLSDLSEINVRVQKHQIPTYIYFPEKSWTAYPPESQLNRSREIHVF